MSTESRATIMKEIEAVGVVAVIRGDSAGQAVDVCRALIAGGVTACEIAMTTPDAIKAIAMASEQFGDEGLIGVGTVLDAETARAAIDAGARFVFSPIVNTEVITVAHEHDVPAVPGALSPTEIMVAWNAGADMVKIFPANHFGPRYIKDIHGPLPDVKLTPTGGVDLNTAGEWIKAGAVSLGVGSSLVKKDLIRAGKWDELAKLAGEYVQCVRKAREAIAKP